MKIKYLRLSKDDKKRARCEFNKTPKGIAVRKNLRNALLCALLSIIYAGYLLWDYFNKNKILTNVVMSVTLIIFAIISFIMVYKIYLKSVNQYVVDNKNMF